MKDLFMITLLAVMLSSCCVFKTKPGLQPTGSFACAQFGGDSDNSIALPGFQIGTFFILTPEACSKLSEESSKASEASVEVGMLVSGKGNKTEMEELGGDGFEPYSYKARTRTTYLDIPIVASVPVYKGLSIYAGPQTSILLGAKTITESNGQKNTANNKDGFNKVDFGLSMGVGYELKNGLSFGLGYDHGLSNVYKSDYGSSNIKNRFFKGTIGLNINKFKNR